jgi:hypothetical protein
MSNPASTNPAAARRASNEPTHLIGASRTPRFRRSGLQFTAEKQAWALADLRTEWGATFDEKLKAVLSEPNIVAKLGTAAEATAEAKPATPREVQLESENAALTARVAALEARLNVLEAPKG